MVEKKHIQGGGNQVGWICWVQIWKVSRVQGKSLSRQQELLMVLERGRPRNKVVF